MFCGDEFYDDDVTSGPAVQSWATCPECNREFDLDNEDDAQEWFYGHDCEV